MLESMASPVISFLLKKLDELLSEEIKLLLGVKPQFESLRMQLRLINASLKTLDSNRTQNPRVVKNWISELRDAAFEAEDIIDDFFLEIDQHQHIGFMGSLTSCVICIRETPARHDIGTRIEASINKIRGIFEQRNNFGIEIKPIEGGPSCPANRGPSELDKAAISQGLKVVGFVKPEISILDELLQGGGGRKVISIVGMGGLGKTTITKKVYNRADVEKHFKHKAWITVSRQHTEAEILRGILKGILECIPGTRHEKQQITGMEEEELVSKLNERLRNVRYLVVVDDIWDVKAWDYINTALPVDAPGSRVMLTTRIKDVAVHAKPGTIHELPFLTDEESWELFCLKVFPNSGCPIELREVGTEMLNKCGGLPLAIVVLGGLLTGKQQQRYVWQRIRDDLTHKLSAERGQMIKDILALSYDDLPDDLKSCFLYVGLFPEDVEINTAKLIQLWVAEGLVQQEDWQTMEETAEEHLETLCNRSILQVVERDAMSRVSKCKIHDLLLELANTEGEQNQFLDVHGDFTKVHEVKSRRLAIHQSMSNCFESSRCFTPKLHSLLCFNLHGQDMCDLFASLKLIRVIDIEGAPIEMLPKEIGSMVRLKYLGLRRTKLSSLPSSVKMLCRLETVDIMDIRGISLPEAVWNMKTLRHIHASGVQPHSSCGDLKELQTLHTATADRWIQTSLGRLTNLRKLGIEGISNSHVRSLSEAIQKLNHLNFLKLKGGSIPNVLGLALTRHDSLHDLYLKGEMGRIPNLNPKNLPPNLTQIILDGSKLEQDPLALLEKLPYLSILRLFSKSFVGDEMVCSEEGFPLLQELCICNLTGLQRLKMQHGSMRCLKSLTIKDCPELEMLPEGLESVTTLKELTLENMATEFTDNIAVDGMDWYKVQHIDHIDIF